MNTLKPLVVLVAAALTLSACGKSEEKKNTTQVAAKVNAGEITVHQINFALQRIPGLKQEQLPEAKTQVLDNLISQELAVQQAVESKLDRDPNVQQMIEAAKRDILAKAYLEQATKNIAKPTAEEIHKYYVDHPDLFSARKIYKIEEIGFNPKPEAISLVNDLIAKNKSSTEILAALKSNGIEAGGGVTVKPAEQIPLELLPKIAQSKEGQPQLVTIGDKAAIFTVQASKAEPIAESAAKPVIEQFIANKAKAELTTNTLKQLREKAAIEYQGEFANAAPVAQPKTEPKSAEQKSSDKDSIAKGVAGLK